MWTNGNLKYEKFRNRREQIFTPRPCGKCMVRIIHARLYAFAEHHNILDAEQGGFRRFRGTSHSLLRFTQNVLSGFGEKTATLPAFINIEKAFDSVWRDGLLVKLHEKGLTGTLWNWIADFLQNRSATYILKNKPGDYFRTELGLPQGSGLSPLLFSISLSDIYTGMVGEKVEFTDVGTFWISGDIPQELSLYMAKDLQNISKMDIQVEDEIECREVRVCSVYKRSKSCFSYCWTAR